MNKSWSIYKHIQVSYDSNASNKSNKLYSILFKALLVTTNLNSNRYKIAKTCIKHVF